MTDGRGKPDRQFQRSGTREGLPEKGLAALLEDVKSLQASVTAGRRGPQVLSHRPLIASRTPGSVAPIRHFTEQLVEAGAVLVLAGPPVTRHLVGHVAWHGDGTVFWFRAGGTGRHDAHRLSYDGMKRVANCGVCLFLGDRIVGYFSTIARAGVADPREFETSALIWADVLPERRPAICRSCVALHRDGDGVRHCAWRACGPDEFGFA